MVEQYLDMVEVVGSSPIPCTALESSLLIVRLIMSFFFASFFELRSEEEELRCGMHDTLAGSSRCHGGHVEEEDVTIPRLPMYRVYL